ncbi:MAG: PEP-CTERM sorting domain-containing protein [Gemmatimonadaceae bacterium]|jgi:hypothetical protein|nr:PEP-CTERM sorting domain-containing protein [Gemmatimonadaceae bacterium]
MSTIRRLSLLAAAVVALSTPATSHAQFLQYTTLAAWQASVLNPGVDTFNDLPTGTLAGPLNRTAGSFAYRASVAIAGQNFYNVGPAADRWLSTFASADTIVLNTFATPVRAVGGFFFGTDAPGAFLPNVTIRVFATTAIGTSVFTLPNTTTTSFFGLTSTANITSVRITAVQPTTGPAPFVTANDLRLAQTVVPEPDTYLMLGTGLVLLGVVTRRRRAA